MNPELNGAARAIWAQTMHDYQHALAIARKAWPENTPSDTLQAAAATILIHHRDLARPAPARRSPPFNRRPT